MKRSELIAHIRTKKSFLCVGLDTDVEKIPQHLKSLKDPIFAFNKEIIDQTKDHAVAYKLNLAFYEAHGLAGWEALMKTVEYIPNSHFTIADAKRGDIGNTADMYAKAFFHQMNFDAVTLSPYMGHDSIKPFLKDQGKWAIVLGLTSNTGAADFQMKPLQEGTELYEYVIRESATWGSSENMMYVVGATRGATLHHIRKIIPEHFLLVPGVGAQGASLSEIVPLMNKDVGMLVNSSRGIIYAGKGEDFGEKAGTAAHEMTIQMAGLLDS